MSLMCIFLNSLTYLDKHLRATSPIRSINILPLPLHTHSHIYTHIISPNSQANQPPSAPLPFLFSLVLSFSFLPVLRHSNAGNGLGGRGARGANQVKFPCLTLLMQPSSFRLKTSTDSHNAAGVQ